jgi:hypothetical protein
MLGLHQTSPLEEQDYLLTNTNGTIKTNLYKKHQSEIAPLLNFYPQPVKITNKMIINFMPITKNGEC